MFLDNVQLDELSLGLSKLNINFSNETLFSFDIYAQNLYRWNEKINLTRVPKEEVVVRHFIDSLSILEFEDFSENDFVLDIGTGAGFPGLPLKIAKPNLNIMLLDSSLKKIDFLDYIIKKLELKKIKTIHSTIDDYQKKASGMFTVVTARALANLETLIKYAEPFLTKNGEMIFLKSQKEIKEDLEGISNRELSYEILRKEKFIILKRK